MYEVCGQGFRIKRTEGFGKPLSQKFFAVALFGLRRVGKTRLLLEFIKSKGLYFFINKNKTSADLLSEFQEILKKNNVLGKLEAIDSWDKFFETIIKRNTLPVVFDEFQNFGSVEHSVFGILQKNIDLNENNPGLFIFSGSLIGLMKNLFKSSKEPLYGRIKKAIKLEPLKFESCLEFGQHKVIPLIPHHTSKQSLGFHQESHVFMP